MSEARCSYSDMLVGQCAERCCRPDLQGFHPRAEDVVKPVTSRPFAAKFPGRCAHCGHTFPEGEQIRYADEDLIHADCADEDEAGTGLADLSKVTRARADNAPLTWSDLLA
jgi:hypothetical protein